MGNSRTEITEEPPEPAFPEIKIDGKQNGW